MIHFRQTELFPRRPSPSLTHTDFIRYSKCECGMLSLYYRSGARLVLHPKDKPFYFPNVDLRHIHRMPGLTKSCPNCEKGTET